MNDKVVKYKVLLGGMVSPYQGMKYELGKTLTCDDFDSSEMECSRGFYATDVEGLVYAFRNQPNHHVYECHMGGREVRISPHKHRWETQTIVREMPLDEVRSMAKAEEARLGYLLSEAIFPIHPLQGEPTTPTVEHIAMLRQWISVGDSVGDSVGYSVRASVWASVWASVRASVGDSVGYSVRASVGDSVGDSVYGYIATLFPNITEWKYVPKELGPQPYKCIGDLWRAGLVPSYDGETWRLHSGEKAAIVWEGKL